MVDNDGPGGPTAIPVNAIPYARSVGAAVICWLGALFTGPIAPIVVLVLGRNDRVTPTRAHAIAATAVWGLSSAIYLPVFLFGILLPSFYRDSGGPRPWALLVALAIAATTWIATCVGLVVVYRQQRRGAWTDAVQPNPPPLA